MDQVVWKSTFGVVADLVCSVSAKYKVKERTSVKRKKKRKQQADIEEDNEEFGKFREVEKTVSFIPIHGWVQSLYMIPDFATAIDCGPPPVFYDLKRKETLPSHQLDYLLCDAIDKERMLLDGDQSVYVPGTFFL